MMLYYFPEACSLAVHIALRETRQRFRLVKVNAETRRLEDGRDYLEINPKGSVPALSLGNGEILTETAVILQYVVSRAGRSYRFLPVEHLARLRCLEWLNYIATELHKSASPLFRASTPADFVKPGMDHLFSRIAVADSTLRRQDYLGAGGYSVADMYLFAVARWLPVLQCDIRRWPGLAAHHARLLERPQVRTALAAETCDPGAEAIHLAELENTDPSACPADGETGCQRY